MATRWMVTDFSIQWDGDVPTMTLTTDVPVHIYAQHTDRDIRVHLRQADDRGLTKMDDPKYCFVEYEETEQEEPADTTEHTVILPELPVCHTRHFVFRATDGGLDTVSNTGILTYHRKPLNLRPYLVAQTTGIWPLRITPVPTIDTRFIMVIS